jgi:hypothetical protein
MRAACQRPAKIAGISDIVWAYLSGQLHHPGRRALSFLRSSTGFGKPCVLCSVKTSHNLGLPDKTVDCNMLKPSHPG